MNISGMLVKATEWLRPILLKIFPNQFLRYIKKKLIKDGYIKMLGMSREQFQRTKYKDGINLIGNIKADTGLGQSCRLIAAELEKTRLPYSVYQYNQIGVMSNANLQFESKITKDLPYNINLIHINPHELGMAFLQLDRSIWKGRYNIGFWLWELEEFPDEWIPCFRLLDEIWTPSEFISNSIRKKTELPVITVPYHVTAPIANKYARSDFSLPEDVFLFMMMYDRTSVTERKNPGAVIEAYKMAFKQNEKTGLVIKINNCTDEEIQELKASMENHPNVYFITEILNRDQVSSLIQCVDVVVSLHRAEGFGLVLAEAMLLGTPVIATNWSSNTEFMTAEVSCLVDYKLVELQENIGLFKKGNHWANANVEQAATFMRKLYEEPEYHQMMSKQAKTHIEDRLSMEQAVNIINDRISRLYG